MADFTTRVELHDADESDYETLHTAMEKRGFSRQITSNKGTVFELPTAEYDISGNYDIAQVLTKAKAAADETGKEFEVLVTKAAQRKWYNLKPA